MGKQRWNRRACGKDGASHRFLAALAAAAATAFLIAGPVAAVAAAWSGSTKPALTHHRPGGADQANSSARSEGDQGSGDRSHSDAGHRQRDHEDQQGGQRSSGSSTPPVTTPQLPVPPTLPSSPVHGNLVAATPGSATATAAATPGAVSSPASGGHVVRTRTPAAGAANGALAAGGLAAAPPAAAPTPPGDVFPTPGVPKGASGALQTARSYSLLLALAAAVVVFLAVQGRLGRRDPRISAPLRDELDFEDFE